MQPSHEPFTKGKSASADFSDVRYGSVGPPPLFVTRKPQSSKCHDAFDTTDEYKPLLIPKPRTSHTAIDVDVDSKSIILPTPNKPPTRHQSFSLPDIGRGMSFSALTYGLVNSIMCVPVLYGYASIIFRNEIYSPFMPSLSKLCLFSSVVHQCVFSSMSTLPFAIGQVQDAGLLFLSKMADIIAEDIASDPNSSPKEAVSTAIVLLGLCTTLTGVSLIVMGKLKLARLVGYIPVPVVGGYLAFIGYFCLQAGVALCISKPMSTIESWASLFDEHALILAIPGVATGALFLYIAKRQDKYLPILMCVVPILFYALIFAIWGNNALPSARTQGWVGKATGEPPSASDVFSLIEFKAVKWSCFGGLLTTWAGMFIVVGFSSTLDVAAISMDMGEVLSTDSELITVGVSNFISGLFGGFTGSYIFSQTIFQYRTRCWSRWVGVIVAGSELFIFFLQHDVLSFSPLFFFGATLIFIGFDLLIEWLYEIREKLLSQEYFVLVLTFVAIQVFGIDAGVIIGVFLSVVDYTRTTSAQDHKHYVRKIERRSRKVRSLERWKRVQAIAYNGQVFTFELRGVLYFGNSIQLLRMLFRSIGIDSDKAFDFDAMHSSRPGRHIASPPPPRRGTGARIPTKKLERRRSSGGKIFPRFIVLDFHNVQTVDASAIRTIQQFVQTANKHKIVVCAAGFTPRIRSFLEASKVISKDPPSSSATKLLTFVSVSKSLEFCEECLIDELQGDPELMSPEKISPKHIRSTSLQDINVVEPHSLLRLIHVLLGRKRGSTLEVDQGLVLDEFHSVVSMKPGELLFSEVGDDDSIDSDSEHSNFFFFVLDGHVESFKTGEKVTVLERGQVVGYVDFLLGRPRTFNARVALGGESAVLAKLTRSQMEDLSRLQADIYALVERCVLRCSIIELANVDEC